MLVYMADMKALSPMGPAKNMKIKGKKLGDLNVTVHREIIYKQVMRGY